MDDSSPDSGDAGTGADPPDLIVDPDANSASVSRCWRCRKLFSASDRCPFCFAAVEKSTLARQATLEGDVEGNAASSAVVPIFWVFGAMAVASIIMAFAMPAMSEPATDDEILHTYHMIGVLEFFDIIIIVIGASVILSRIRLPIIYKAQPVLAWSSAVPLLACAILFNFAYHHVLGHVGFGTVDDPLTFQNGHVTWLVLTVCVQPAIVEEFFFRYICLGVFEKAVGTGTAIFVSAMIFGAAHIGALASLPVLFVIGLLLGWLRVKSGGLALPILVHFAHNLVVSTVSFG